MKTRQEKENWLYWNVRGEELGCICTGEKYPCLVIPFHHFKAISSVLCTVLMASPKGSRIVLELAGGAKVRGHIVKRGLYISRKEAAPWTILERDVFYVLPLERIGM